ncbi:right-handed parallel beta-helix repeat-containing protein [Neotamlana laminarinivorans]|uniref:Right-handed parallel beta-helix repeat-containing protein n=1 Tax=Neotamlana laminarinivorans TaxID=2883124 RepID=A0A9X1L3H5_9FLAO|nr:T9SS type A sorting domain-containing protein [Tamlana laminarinivorans]MCB4798252.1 right-handed parallel beta-helix repeat-containing protein [Tamlana laminarinivorans]
MYKIITTSLVLLFTTIFYAQEKPTAENTGYTGTLTNYTGSTTIQTDNTVIENKLISGTIRIYANNVTIRNCKITTGGFYGIDIKEGENILIEDCEIEGMQSAAILGRNFTARRCNIWNSGADGIKPYSNFLIESCYFHHLGYVEDAHADGIQLVREGGGIITGNNFDMGPASGYKNSQCIIIQSNDAAVDDIVIDGNWINGGGYSVQIRERNYGPPTNISITNNLFGRDAQFGTHIIDGDNSVTNNVFNCNRYEDTNELVEGTTCDETLSTNNIELSNNIISYPNPITNELYVLENQGANYELYSNTGKLIMKNTITSNNFNVKTNNLTSGIYVLKIFTKEGVTTKKIIKN